VKTISVGAALALGTALGVGLALGACQSSDVSRDLGARCTADTDCAQKCLGPDADWPGGFCTTVCDVDTDCGDNARCLAEDSGVCAFSCGSDGDCAFLDGNYVCVPEDPETGGLKVMVCRGD
jgi:hypothetical protein